MTANIDKQWFLARMAERGKSLTEVAKGLGIDKSALSRALDGKRHIKPLEVGRIATILGATREDVVRHLEGIESRSGKGRRSGAGAEHRSKGTSRVDGSLSKTPPAGFGEEPQADFGSSTRPRHPGIGFMKGLIKFAPGFDGTGPYSDERWDEGYLGEDRIGEAGRKGRAK